MLNSKERKVLMSKAQKIKPSVQIGKNGVTPTVLSEIQNVINKQELIKVTLLQNTMVEKQEVIDQIQEFDKKILEVQTIGSKVVLYKVAPKEKDRNISNQIKDLRR